MKALGDASLEQDILIESGLDVLSSSLSQKLKITFPIFMFLY